VTVIAAVKSWELSIGERNFGELDIGENPRFFSILGMSTSFLVEIACHLGA
jgi:hypothetical protein